MSSPGASGGTNAAAELFQDLWSQLREVHQSALQELEAKVSRLKKERCLDAQRLEVFYSRNQQLKEQSKSLQDTVSLLEERLRAAEPGSECDRCAVLEEKLKTEQDQNLRLITKLKNERNGLEDENRKLHAELQSLKSSELQSSTPEQEEGIIPDSPILHSSLPVGNKLKQRRNVERSRRVRYAELPLPKCNSSLFAELNKEPVEASKNPERAEVLVPNTCVLDPSQISEEVNHETEGVVTETCGFQLDGHHLNTEKAADRLSSSKPVWKNGVSLKSHCSSASSTPIHSPGTATENSPSLLHRVQRSPQDVSIHRAKRKKEEAEPEVQEGSKLRKCTSSSFTSQSLLKQPLDRKVQPSGDGPNASCVNPAPKPNGKVKEGADVGRRGSLQQAHNTSYGQRQRHKVEPMWSIDPALALSMYDSEWRGDEQEEDDYHGGQEDTDCTWVSHSVLQRRGESGGDRRDSASGLGEKANDSLDLMFDTTACGEYKSYNSTRLGQSQACEGGEEEEEEEGEEEEEKEECEREPAENTPDRNKARRPDFAHVAVIRKKDERRKLKGATCKECETYYSHLPEEERRKKLSSCSRHRFLYVPPCTPENFWEVGFPSTQTCIERGYIREETSPQVRSRRRQPFNAQFSTKQES